MGMEQSWRSFMRRHWGAALAVIAAVALAFAGVVYVFWWFAGDATSTNLVPSILGLWTMANVLSFVLYLIFWELVLVGIPVVVGAVVVWMWWKRLPPEERAGYHFGRRGRSAGGGGGFGLLFFLAFCLKVWLDGKWNDPISNFTLGYIVGSTITILAWGLVVLGIPAAVALTWWLRRETRRP